MCDSSPVFVHRFMMLLMLQSASADCFVLLGPQDSARFFVYAMLIDSSVVRPILRPGHRVV